MLKSKYKNIEPEVPEWHKNIVRERLEHYKSNPNDVKDFEKALDEIEKEL
ncbi:MAG: hypothetical protein ACJA08_002537 [Cyclobacteriaceae bacterium]|jgi:hypothetical protein